MKLIPRLIPRGYHPVRFEPGCQWGLLQSQEKNGTMDMENLKREEVVTITEQYAA